MGTHPIFESDFDCLTVKRMVQVSNKPADPAKMKTAGFTVKSRMKASVVVGPPSSGAFRVRPTGPTQFRKFYERGDFPIALEHDTKGNRISWKVELEKLDYHHYLPLFFDGLCETQHPHEFFARQGIHDMLEHGNAQVLPHLVPSADMVGEALVPYYRQILPILNLFKNDNSNTGDGIDYSQQKRENVGALIQETLEAFERHGGPDA